MQFEGFGARGVGLCKCPLVMIYRVVGTGLLGGYVQCAAAQELARGEERNRAYFR